MDEKWEQWYTTTSKTLGCCALCSDTGFRKVPKAIKSYMSFYGLPTLEIPDGFETVPCFKCKGRNDLRISVSVVKSGTEIILQNDFKGLYGNIPAGTYSIKEFVQFDENIWRLKVDVGGSTYGYDLLWARFGFMPKGIRLAS